MSYVRKSYAARGDRCRYVTPVWIIALISIMAIVVISILMWLVADGLITRKKLGEKERELNALKAMQIAKAKDGNGNGDGIMDSVAGVAKNVYNIYKKIGTG
jgi:aldehyde:ferredoxin oxidoreductase